MLSGGVLGVLFVTFLRRSMVEETDLPFPESVAAAEIVKAENKGVLLSSGLIAGEALMAVILAFVVLGERLGGSTLMVNGEPLCYLKHLAVNVLGVTTPSIIASLMVFAGLTYLLVAIPLKSLTKKYSLTFI